MRSFLALLTSLTLVAVSVSAFASRRGEAGLSPLETRVLGTRNWLRGGPAALRVIVADHNTGKPLRSNVELTLTQLVNGKPSGESHKLYNGPTDRLGTLDAAFRVPSVTPGAYTLLVAVASPLGSDKVEQPIQVAESAQVMLSSDKPLYQPGQIMHMRALALDMANRHARTGPVTFEVEDARGNKVFKKHETLSKFGIAGCDFELADEVNMGTFTLRAVLPETQVEKKVNVQRYVLPKFKVNITADKPYYLPGELVKGAVESSYFFGKPVVFGNVDLTLSTIDIGVTKLIELKGTTDSTGSYKFEFRLPDSFVGQPFEQGKAVVEIAAGVRDTADHKQEGRISIPVVKQPVLIATVPESRVPVPNLPNRLYIAVATPDGKPLTNAKVEVTDNGKSDALTTDEMGLATYTFTPGAQPVTFNIKATDAAGRSATTPYTSLPNGAKDGVILRSDKTIAKVGERLNLTALSTVKTGTLYLDVIRNRQTILTRAEPMANGRSEIALPVTADMAGTLQIHAYKILPNEEIIRDTRTIVVTPATDLEIKATADQAQYKPGQDATVRFAVTDDKHRPVQAALGLAVVDESVFALSELQPGLEKIYFTLEKELMEPKYEIHGLRPTFLIEPPHPGPMPPHPLPIRREEEASRQRAACMILAAAPEADSFDFNVNTYLVRFQKMVEEVVQEMARAQRKIMQAVAKWRQQEGTALTADQSLTALVDKGLLADADLKDRWGHYYKANLYGRTDYEGYFTLSSAGPDGKWDTADDVKEIYAYGGRGGIRPQHGRFGGIAGFGGGGFGGGARFEAQLAAPGPQGPPGVAEDAARPVMFKAAMMRERTVNAAANAQPGGGAEPVRVREYFPETMFWNPSLITDEHGLAMLNLPMADSITTWRMSMTANSVDGQLGSGTVPIKAFQDFFVDIDLPVSLTQHDRVEVPVAIYNYMQTTQSVTLTLAEEPWFALQGPAKQTVEVGKGEVKVIHYPITVRSIGHFPLTVTARGSRLSDAVKRSVDVLPDGKEFVTTVNDRLEGKIDKTVNIPGDAIEGASSLWVKLYPGAFSQVVEGLDGILRMPNGCFEQTSSTTFPNVLVLDYLKQTKHINPELQMKAEGYINVGYQRLVTFECKSGGFSWFGNEPAHQMLTAYGLLEFSDMAKVHDVDPSLIGRTQNWLASKQKPDGTWEETNQGIAEGIINRQTGALRSTAYVAWALAESGYKGPQVARGVDYVKSHKGEAKDPYTLAVMLNLLGIVDRDGDATGDVARQVIDMAKTTEKTAYWQSDTKTFTGARGEGADLETTGLAAFGLAKWGRNGGFLNKVLTYLVQSKDAFGTWQSTQGTVWSMKALLFASRNAVGGGKGTVTVLANGEKAASIAITPDNSDVMRQISLAKSIKPGANAVTLQYEGDGSMLYQIVGRYYVGWDKIQPPINNIPPLSLDVKYDKTKLAQDDVASVTVKIHNNTDRIAEMPLIDVGVPPGFTVVPDQLDALVANKTISKYTIAARQVIVYLEKLEPGQTVTVTYQVRAKFPIKARTPLSKVYPYYEPNRVAISEPQDVVVTK